jgi:hypothetical protein
MERRAGSACDGASNVSCCRHVRGRLNAALSSGSQKCQKKTGHEAQEASAKRRSNERDEYAVRQEHRKCNKPTQKGCDQQQGHHGSLCKDAVTME